MANQTTTNPYVLDTGATISTRMKIQQIQWIDDAADVADDNVLDFDINGQNFTGKLAMTANTLNNLCVYQAGPFTTPIECHEFILNTITKGELVIWLA